MKQYIVFQCLKCHEYTYASIGQKEKKCPRCGRNHRMEKIKGENVDGLTAAMMKVKEKQNLILGKEKLAFKSSVPEIAFVNSIENRIEDIKKQNNIDREKYEINRDLADFILKIHNFQTTEQIDKKIGFPEYILDLISEDLDIAPFYRKKLIEKLKTLPSFIELENRNVYLKY